MSDLDPKTISALDQFSGVISQIADITVAHHDKLTDGHIPRDLAAELTGDLHDALLVLFVKPKEADAPPPDE